FSLVLGSVVWLVLTGRFEPGALLAGALVVASGTAITIRLSEVRQRLPLRRLPQALYAIAGYLLRSVLPDLVSGCLRLARRVLSPRPEPGGLVVAVSVPEASDEALLLLAAGISL